ncbi:hypothetical protein [Rhodococcus opacus]|nr:hypothetical protein [Rhodococcus opacus]MBV6758408.1 hypothetical protein [Rhodococcus opacus]
MNTRQRHLERITNDPDALPLLFNIDRNGHEYDTDLLDLATQEARK